MIVSQFGSASATTSSVATISRAASAACCRHSPSARSERRPNKPEQRQHQEEQQINGRIKINNPIGVVHVGNISMRLDYGQRIAASLRLAGLGPQLHCTAANHLSRPPVFLPAAAANVQYFVPSFCFSLKLPLTDYDTFVQYSIDASIERA